MTENIESQPIISLLDALRYAKTCNTMISYKVQ